MSRITVAAILIFGFAFAIAPFAYAQTVQASADAQCPGPKSPTSVYAGLSKPATYTITDSSGNPIKVTNLSQQKCSQSCSSGGTISGLCVAQNKCGAEKTCSGQTPAKVTTQQIQDAVNGTGSGTSGTPGTGDGSGAGAAVPASSGTSNNGGVAPSSSLLNDVFNQQQNVLQPNTGVPNSISGTSPNTPNLSGGTIGSFSSPVNTLEGIPSSAQPTNELTPTTQYPTDTFGQPTYTGTASANCGFTCTVSNTVSGWWSGITGIFSPTPQQPLSPENVDESGTIDAFGSLPNQPTEAQVSPPGVPIDAFGYTEPSQPIDAFGSIEPGYQAALTQLGTQVTADNLALQNAQTQLAAYQADPNGYMASLIQQSGANGYAPSSDEVLQTLQSSVDAAQTKLDTDLISQAQCSNGACSPEILQMGNAIAAGPGVGTQILNDIGTTLQSPYFMTLPIVGPAMGITIPGFLSNTETVLSSVGVPGFNDPQTAINATLNPNEYYSNLIIASGNLGLIAFGAGDIALTNIGSGIGNAVENLSGSALSYEVSPEFTANLYGTTAPFEPPAIGDVSPGDLGVVNNIPPELQSPVPAVAASNPLAGFPESYADALKLTTTQVFGVNGEPVVSITRDVFGNVTSLTPSGPLSDVPVLEAQTGPSLETPAPVNSSLTLPPGFTSIDIPSDSPILSAGSISGQNLTPEIISQLEDAEAPAGYTYMYRGIDQPYAAPTSDQSFTSSLDGALTYMRENPDGTLIQIAVPKDYAVPYANPYAGGFNYFTTDVLQYPSSWFTDEIPYWQTPEFQTYLNGISDGTITPGAYTLDQILAGEATPGPSSQEAVTASPNYKSYLTQLGSIPGARIANAALETLANVGNPIGLYEAYQPARAIETLASQNIAVPSWIDSVVPSANEGIAIIAGENTTDALLALENPNPNIPVVAFTSPALGETAPVSAVPAPSVESPAPAVTNPSPEQVSPVASAPSPTPAVAATPAPVITGTTPSPASVAPAAATPAPTIQTPAPVLTGPGKLASVPNVLVPLISYVLGSIPSIPSFISPAEAAPVVRPAPLTQAVIDQLNASVQTAAQGLTALHEANSAGESNDAAAQARSKTIADGLTAAQNILPSLPGNLGNNTYVQGSLADQLNNYINDAQKLGPEYKTYVNSGKGVIAGIMLGFHSNSVGQAGDTLLPQVQSYVDSLKPAVSSPTPTPHAVIAPLGTPAPKVATVDIQTGEVTRPPAEATPVPAAVKPAPAQVTPKIAAALPGLTAVSPQSITASAAQPIISIQLPGGKVATYQVAPGIPAQNIPELTREQTWLLNNAGNIPANAASIQHFIAKPAQTATQKLTPAQVYQTEMDYLFQHYQADPRDQQATQRMSLSLGRPLTLEQYVIGGMNPNLVTNAYFMGKALDAAGMQWKIVTAFRDNYRQGLVTSWPRAAVGNSWHGNTPVTCGYGCGLAIDFAGAGNTSSQTLYNWIDQSGQQYGLGRPYGSGDPDHVTPTNSPEYTKRRGSPSVNYQTVLTQQQAQLANLTGQGLTYDLYSMNGTLLKSGVSLPSSVLLKGGPAAIAANIAAAQPQLGGLTVSPNGAITSANGTSLKLNYATPLIMGGPNVQGAAQIAGVDLSTLKVSPDGTITDAQGRPVQLRQVLGLGIPQLPSNPGNIKSAADRAAVAQQAYTIVKSLGIQPSDLALGSPNFGKAWRITVEVTRAVLASRGMLNQNLTLGTVIGVARQETGVPGNMNEFTSPTGVRGLMQVTGDSALTILGNATFNTWQGSWSSKNFAREDNIGSVITGMLEVNNDLYSYGGNVAAATQAFNSGSPTSCVGGGCKNGVPVYGASVAQDAAVISNIQNTCNGNTACVMQGLRGLASNRSLSAPALNAIASILNATINGGVPLTGGNTSGNGNGNGTGNGTGSGAGAGLSPGAVGAPGGPAFDPNQQYQLVAENADGSIVKLGSVIAGTAIGTGLLAYYYSVDTNGQADGKITGTVSTQSTDGSSEVAVLVDNQGNLVLDKDNNPIAYDPTSIPPGTWSPSGDTYTVNAVPPPSNPWHPGGSGNPYGGTPGGQPANQGYCYLSTEPIVAVPCSGSQPAAPLQPARPVAAQPPYQTSPQPISQPLPQPAITPTTPTTPPSLQEAFVSIVANPSSLRSGGRSNISWSSVGTASCEVGAEGAALIGTSTSGSAQTPQLATTTSFTALCQTLPSLVNGATNATVSATTSVIVQ